MWKPAPWLTSAAMLCFAIRACAPIERVWQGPDFWPAEILVTNSWYLRLLSWMPLCGLLLLAGATVLLIRMRKRNAGIGILGLGFIGFVGSWAVFILSNLSPWTVCDTWHSPDGTSYSFLDSSFLQGQLMVISRRVDSSFLARREKILGGNNGDWPRSWATVIRPEDESDKRYGRLMHSESGWLLGMRYDDRCYLAYHLPTGQFLGHGDIESISPFLLMNADTVPEPRDVAGLVERLVENPSAGPGRPNESVLREALTHANPHVRDIARQLLAVLEGHELPE